MRPSPGGFPGATQKMLTQTLRQMERDGARVSCTVTPTVPPAVDYELTELGRSLLELQLSVLAWGEGHMATVREARSAYGRGGRPGDARGPRGPPRRGPGPGRPGAKRGRAAARGAGDPRR